MARVGTALETAPHQALVGGVDRAADRAADKVAGKVPEADKPVPHLTQKGPPAVADTHNHSTEDYKGVEARIVVAEVEAVEVEAVEVEAAKVRPIPETAARCGYIWNNVLSAHCYRCYRHQ